MAHFAKKRLQDEASQKWLEDNGFVNVKDCSRDSAWDLAKFDSGATFSFIHLHFPRLYFPIDKQIRGYDDLLLHVYEKSHEKGYAEGKKEAQAEAISRFAKVIEGEKTVNKEEAPYA